MPPTDKNKTKQSDGVSSSDLDALYDKISNLQGKQYNKGTANNDFKPSMVELPSSPTAPVQTKFAGTAFYDNTPSTFIAPAYGQYKDLSIKRSNQAIATHSAWDKTKANLASNIPQIDDEDYKAVQANFMKSMDDYEEKLKQGDWADQSSMVSSFVDDLINKKGGKHFAKLAGQQAERRTAIEEGLAKYDNEKNIDGLSPSDVAFYSTPTKFDKPVADPNDPSNIIGGINLQYPTIMEKRNLIAEGNESLKLIKASARQGTRIVKDENGEDKEETVFYLPTDMEGKYRIDTTKGVTEQQIVNAMLGQLDVNGGNSYIQREGEIREFNSPLSADGYRKILTQIAGTEGADPAYGKLLDLDDETLVKYAKEHGLGAKFQAQDIKENLLKSLTNIHSYSETSFDHVTDEVVQAVATAAGTYPYKDHGSDSGSGSGSGGGGKGTGLVDEYGNPVNEDTPYLVTTTNLGMYNGPNKYGPAEIASAVNGLNTELDIINKGLKQFPNVDPLYPNNAKYKDLLRQKEDVDRKLGYVKTFQKTIFKQLSDVAREKTNITLSNAVHIIQSQSIGGKKIGLATADIATALQSAISAELDDDPKTTATAIFAKAGIPTRLDISNNDYYKTTADKKSKDILDKFVDFKQTRKKGTQSPLSVKAGGGGGTYENIGPPGINILKYAQSVGQEYKRLKKKGETKASDVTVDMSVIDVMEESAKFPEAIRYKATMKDVAKLLSDPALVPSHNPFGKSTKTLKTELKEAGGIEDHEVSDMFELSEVRLSKMQSFNSKDGGLVYLAEYKVNDFKENENKELYKKAQKLKEKLKGNIIRLPITLGRNNHKDQQVKNDLLKLINVQDNTQTGIPSSVRQGLLLTASKIEGVEDAIDSAYLYGLDGSGKNPTKQIKTIKVSGTDMQVKGINSVYSSAREDMSFQIKVKDPADNQFKHLAIDKMGAVQYATDAQLKASNGSLTIKPFDTTEDIKAYVTEVMYRKAGLIGKPNFKKGGSKTNQTTNHPAIYGTDRPADKSHTYKVDLVRNGQVYKTDAYIPKEQMYNLTGKVKIASNAGIPFINKDIAQKAITLMNANGLTLGGGLRTVQHSPKNGAKNSAHYNGNAIDLVLDNNSIALYNKYQKNPALAKKDGVQFAHDGNHIHLTFAAPENIAKPAKSYSNSKVMNAIAHGESSNQNMGYHYKDKAKNSTAYGKYGFTNEWFPRMAKYFNKPESVIRNSPELIEEYAHTGYMEVANKETNPYFNKLKQRLERYIPNFSKEDAIFLYHYNGIAGLKGIANGTIGIHSVPPVGNNKQSYYNFVVTKRKYLK